jgi:hypothetical protein
MQVFFHQVTPFHCYNLATCFSIRHAPTNCNLLRLQVAVRTFNTSWLVAFYFPFPKDKFLLHNNIFVSSLVHGRLYLSLFSNDINFLRNVQLILTPPVWKSQGWSAAYFSSPSSQLYFKCQRWQYSSVSFVVQIKKLSPHLKLHDSVYFFWLYLPQKKDESKLVPLLDITLCYRRRVEFICRSRQ